MFWKKEVIKEIVVKEPKTLKRVVVSFNNYEGTKFMVRL
jgi:hypothetical protein